MRLCQFILFSFLCLSTIVRAQDSLITVVEKGYLFSITDQSGNLETVVFVPCEKISKKVDFKRLQLRTGMNIKGYLPKTEKNLQKKGKRYDILIPLLNEKGIATVTPFILRIMPVELNYRIDTTGSIDKNGIPFTWKGKMYNISFNYYYNFDVVDAKEL